MGTLELRPYQQEAIDKTYSFWEKGIGNNPLIIAPTGSGKSLIIAQICIDVCKDSKSRILILTHTKELLEQNESELKSIWNEAPTGFYSAGLNKKEINSQILFAGVQSFANNVQKSFAFDLIIIDEAHMINNKNDTRYKKIFDSLLTKNPKTKILGLTATPYRLDGGYIYGEGKIFDGVSHDIDIYTLIQNGYLVKPIAKNAINKIDLTNVSVRNNGEYDDIELAKAVDNEALTTSVVDETIEAGKDRKAWLVFATNINHAIHLKEQFFKKDIIAKIIIGDTHKHERQKTIKDFKDGNLKCLINVGVLTTGFNAPICDLLVIARATQSTSLFVQVVGRVLRLYPEKKNALILDFGDNVLRHGTIDNVYPKIKKAGEKIEQEKKSAKECKKCNTLNKLNAVYCVDCNHEFKTQELDTKTTAFRGDLISAKKENNLINKKVDSVLYAKHMSKAGNECLRITYRYNFEFVTEYILMSDTKRLSVMGLNGLTLDFIFDNRNKIRKPTKITLIKKDGFMQVASKIFELIDNEAQCCFNCTHRTMSGDDEVCDVYKTKIDNEWRCELNTCTHFDGGLPF